MGVLARIAAEPRVPVLIAFLETLHIAVDIAIGANSRISICFVSIE
jgi:hypothetical protein